MLCYPFANTIQPSNVCQALHKCLLFALPFTTTTQHLYRFLCVGLFSSSSFTWFCFLLSVFVDTSFAHMKWKQTNKLISYFVRVSCVRICWQLHVGKIKTNDGNKSNRISEKNYKTSKNFQRFAVSLPKQNETKHKRWNLINWMHGENCPFCNYRNVSEWIRHCVRVLVRECACVNQSWGTFEKMTRTELSKLRVHTYTRMQIEWSVKIMYTYTFAHTFADTFVLTFKIGHCVDVLRGREKKYTNTHDSQHGELKTQTPVFSLSIEVKLVNFKPLSFVWVFIFWWLP